MSPAFSSSPPLLVSAGEASGDRIAAGVVQALGVTACGFGGDALAATGASLCGHLRDVTATGFVAPLWHLPQLFRTASQLLHLAQIARVRVALLVDFTEFHAYLGRQLRRRGVRVVWAVAPQVWAWRPGRTKTLRESFDQLAVLFHFEENLWRRVGVDAHWVGHPALDAPWETRSISRTALGLATDCRAIALLPGSRPNELRRLLPLMLEASTRLRSLDENIHVRLLLAPSLPAEVYASAVRRAKEAGVAVVPVTASDGLSPYLTAFDASLCASGTATLEAALAGAAPVIAYRLDPFSGYLARRLVHVPSMGLPNVLLGRRAYPELFQEEVTAYAFCSELQSLWSQTTHTLALRKELWENLAHPSPGTAVERIAALLQPWLLRNHEGLHFSQRANGSLRVCFMLTSGRVVNGIYDQNMFGAAGVDRGIPNKARVIANFARTITGPSGERVWANRFISTNAPVDLTNT